MKKSERPMYEPPMAKDLSAIVVRGGESGPLGQCINGPRPYYNCAVGSGFVGACIAGPLPDTSACAVGGFHTAPACDAGSNAATICISGSGQNF